MQHGDIKVVCVAPEMLADVWPHVAPMLIKGQLALTPDLDECTRWLAFGLLCVRSGVMQLWIAVDDAEPRILGALVTEVLEGKEGKHVWAMGMGGEGITRWGGPMSDTIAAFAKAEGAGAVRFSGRKGLARVYRGVRIVGRDDEHGQLLFERAVT